MVRRKVNLAYITNDSERKACYRKRKKGLIKKVSELSTLCGVEACCIIYSEYDREGEVWPSHIEAQATLARYEKLSEIEQERKKVDQASYTRQRIKKAEAQLRRLRRENKRKEMEIYMHQCIAGTRTLDDTYVGDEEEMNAVINQTLRKIQARQDELMAEFQRRQALIPPQSAEVPLIEQLPQLHPPLPPPPSDVLVPTMDEFERRQALLPPPSLEQPQLDPPLPPVLLPLPPPPADVLLPPIEEEINLDNFPWHLLASPTEGDAADGLERSDFGWDPAMDPNSNVPSTSGQQGNHGSSSNDFNSNDFDYFNYFYN